MPFQKGQSGNPNGKPKGAFNKNTLVAQALLEGEGEALVRKAVDLALEGDRTCLRICLERLVPAKKADPIRIDIPEIVALTDIPKLFTALTASLREGGLTPAEAGTLIDLAEVLRKSLESVELESRISALKQGSKSRTGR